ncbi:hypothetical protein D5R81_13305 [Parashewanella spongiae]|uniref:Lipoprotein n=1 Tax=Parashewanella spongiae TaxID=342950 RepID=A0A3A6TLM6_9GAMM|nr:lipoprotein [Parashewanella spongiae]MCL1079474.1 lipoprotein [Parashewanella spongiae]RJY11338.1 hypothetical protein D5R81_13305 [Parashewanella spongiae]
MKQLLIIIVAIVASVVLTACGQKGPLYKTAEAETNKSTTTQPKQDKNKQAKTQSTTENKHNN